MRSGCAKASRATRHRSAHPRAVPCAAQHGALCGTLHTNTTGGPSAAAEPRDQMQAAEACRACKSVRRGVQRAQPASGSSGARTSSSAEEHERFGYVQRSKNGMLVACCLS